MVWWKPGGLDNIFSEPEAPLDGYGFVMSQYLILGLMNPYLKQWLSRRSACHSTAGVAEEEYNKYHVQNHYF